MRAAVILACIPVAAWAGTTIAETRIVGPNGRLANGTVTIRSSVPFTAASGARVETRQDIVPIVNGRFSIALEPNDTGFPAGSQYVAQWQIDGAKPRTERWTVPTTGSTLGVKDVVTGTVTPAEGVAFAQLEPGGYQDGMYCIKILGGQVSLSAAGCPGSGSGEGGGGSTLSWASLTAAQWASLTAAQWAALTN